MKRLFVIVVSIFVACSTTPPQPPSPQSESPQPIGGYVAIYNNIVKPKEAQESGTEGEVIIKAFIDKSGTVTETEVVQGLPNTGLVKAAIEAIRKTSWKPARQGGYSLGMWVEIPVAFRGFFQTKSPIVLTISDLRVLQEKEIPKREIPIAFPVPIGGYGEIQRNIMYPWRAQKAGLEGTVVIHSLVNIKGKVVATRVLKGTHPLLDDAAIEAVKRTRFRAAQIEGEPVAMWISIPINFRLR